MGMRDMNGGSQTGGVRTRDWRPARIGVATELHGHRSRKWQDTSRSTPAGDGDPVASWEDVSGNGNDAEQDTTSNQPAVEGEAEYGRDAVLPDGTDDYLLLDTDIRPVTHPNVSIYTVLVEDYTQDAAPWGNDDGGWDRFLWNLKGRNDPKVWGTSDGDGQIEIHPVNDGARSLIEVHEKNGVSDSGEGYYNGDLEKTYKPDHNETDAKKETSLFDLNGDSSPHRPYSKAICHFVLATEKHSSAERDRVQNYMKREWGLN